MYKLLLLKSITIACTLQLIGCNNDNNATVRHQPKVIEVATNVYKVTPEPPPPPLSSPPPEPEPEVVAVEEVNFPNAESLIREIEARRRRGLRQQRYRYRSEAKAIPTPEYVITDQDYQDWEDVPVSVSSLQVNRDRILTQDTRITAIMQDALDSQIGGSAIAIVDRDVLSPTGNNILIPVYSKLICSYEPLGKVGETRLKFACQRLIRPDGVQVMLEMSGSDQMGRTGLIGEVDNRTFQRYGGAFLVSAISALGQMNVSQRDNGNRNMQNAVDAASSNLAQVTTKLIEESIDLAPTITIKQGATIQLRPINDLQFRKPYIKSKEASRAQ